MNISETDAVSANSQLFFTPLETYRDDYKISKVAEWCFVKHPVVTYLTIGAVGIACAIQFPLVPVIAALTLTIFLAMKIHRNVLDNDSLDELIRNNGKQLLGIQRSIPMDLNEFVSFDEIPKLIASYSTRLNNLIDEYNKTIQSLKKPSNMSTVCRESQELIRKITTLQEEITNTQKRMTKLKKFIDTHPDDIVQTQEDLHKIEQNLEALRQDKDYQPFAENSDRDDTLDIDLALKQARVSLDNFLAGGSKVDFDDMKKSLKLDDLQKKIAFVKKNCQTALEIASKKGWNAQELYQLRLLEPQERADSFFPLNGGVDSVLMIMSKLG